MLICRFWALPAVVLRKVVVGHFDVSGCDKEMQQASEFMLHKVNSHLYSSCLCTRPYCLLLEPSLCTPPGPPCLSCGTSFVPSNV